jgi:hypothetical protein
MNEPKEISDLQLKEIWQEIKDIDDQIVALNKILLSQFSDYIVYTAESLYNGEFRDCDGAFFRKDYAIDKSGFIEAVSKDWYVYLSVFVKERQIQWLYHSDDQFEQPFNPRCLLENLQSMAHKFE